MGKHRQEQPKGPYFYRPVRRDKTATGEWGPWRPFAARLAYASLGVARNALSYHKNEVERYYNTVSEWKIQRIPTDAWEDFE